MQPNIMQPAFLFDLNGTIINDMPYHIKAWHTILNSLGATISLEETKLQCYGKNEELIERVLPNKFSLSEKQKIGFEKEKAYQTTYLPHLQLIDGLGNFLKNAYQNNILMAIGSAAIMYNIDFVLKGLALEKYFTAIVSADDVTLSKPHPETFLKCAEKLNVLPENCIVFEDVPKGVEAAANAGMQCVVITTMHKAEEFSSYKNVIKVINDFNDLTVEDLF